MPFPTGAYAAIAWRELTRRAAVPADEVALLAAGVRIADARLPRFRRIVGDRSEVPLTWPHVLSTPLQTALASLPSFPVSPMGLVHVEQSIERLRTISLEDVVDVRCALDDIETTDRGPRLTIVTECFRNDTLVWRGVSTALHRPKRRGGPRRATTQSEPTLPDLSAARRFGSGAGRAYSTVSWDFNPIHLGRLLARPFGFPRAILHGMATVGWAMGRLAPPVTGAATLRCRFRKPLLLPGEARLRAWDDGTWEVTGADPERVFVQGDLAAGD